MYGIIRFVTACPDLSGNLQKMANFPPKQRLCFLYTRTGAPLVTGYLSVTLTVSDYRK